MPTRSLPWGRVQLHFFFPFFSFHLTYSRWTSSLLSCLWSLRIFPSLPASRLTIFLSRCKFSTLTTRQPMVEFYLLTFPRFPLRKKEHKSYFGKNRTHDFRTSRCADYLLDHSLRGSSERNDEKRRLRRYAHCLLYPFRNVLLVKGLSNKTRDTKKKSTKKETTTVVAVTTVQNPFKTRHIITHFHTPFNTHAHTHTLGRTPPPLPPPLYLVYLYK